MVCHIVIISRCHVFADPKELQEKVLRDQEAQQFHVVNTGLCVMNSIPTYINRTWWFPYVGTKDLDLRSFHGGNVSQQSMKTCPRSC